MLNKQKDSLKEKSELSRLNYIYYYILLVFFISWIAFYALEKIEISNNFRIAFFIVGGILLINNFITGLIKAWMNEI